MKVKQNIYVYAAGALILPILFYVLGHVLSCVLRYFGIVTVKPMESWVASFKDTAIVLFGWAFGDWFLKRKQNMIKSQQEQSPVLQFEKNRAG